MATPLMLAQMNGDLTYVDGEVGGTGTSTGPVSYVTGPESGTQAVRIERAATNLNKNPSAEAGYLWFTPIRVTVTNPSGDASVGSRAFLLTRSSVDVNAGMYAAAGNRPTLTDAQRVVLQWAAKSANGVTMTPRISWKPDTEANGPTISQSYLTPHVLTMDWDARGEVVTPPVGAQSFIVEMLDTAIGTVGHSFMLDEVMFEVVNADEAALTTYVDGSLGSGYAWTGTAHDSTSTRAASSVAIPLASLPLHVAVRYSDDDGVTWDTAHVTDMGGVNVGSFGSVDYSAGDLILTSKGSSRIGPVYAFADALTRKEQAVLGSVPAWTYGMALTKTWVDIVPMAGGRADAPVITLP